MIILGSISVTTGTCFMASWVIDATTGRSLRADTVDAGTLNWRVDDVGTGG